MVEPQKQEVKKKRNWLKWLIIFTIPLALISGGLGFYFSVILNNNEANGEISIRDIETLTIDSFTVNLADPGQKRYLRTKITMEYENGRKMTSEIQRKNHRIKDAILIALRSKSVNDLNNIEKTEKLKEELISLVNDILNEGQILGLYFDEFIIQ